MTFEQELKEQAKQPFKRPKQYTGYTYTVDLEKLGKFIEGKRVTPEKTIWIFVILSCIGLAVIGWILWETFMANLYLGL